MVIYTHMNYMKKDNNMKTLIALMMCLCIGCTGDDLVFYPDCGNGIKNVDEYCDGTLFNNKGMMCDNLTGGELWDEREVECDESCGGAWVTCCNSQRCEDFFADGV